MKSKMIFMLASLWLGTAWASPITIQKATGETGERLILADRQGMSLYTFKPDKPNESTCFDGCAKTWPPVLVSEEEAVALTGSLGTTLRPDKTLQLTVDGHPVYLFKPDKKPGDILGEGLGDVWFLLDLKITK